MATARARLATALWIHTHAPVEDVRTALQELPLVSEAAGQGFVHVLYDTEQWSGTGQANSGQPARVVQDRLTRARVTYVPAIGPEILPSA